MEDKISKAQLEVWEWKEKCYEEVKDLPVGERVAFIIKKAKPFSDEIKERIKNRKLKTDTP